MAILWPKIGQRHFGAHASHGHNLAIFHQILTNEHTKMTSSLRRIEWNNSKLYLLVLYIGFLAPFLLRGLTWAMLYVWTKNYPQVVGTCSGHHGQLISQNCVLTKIRAEPPPPPPPPPPLINDLVTAKYSHERITYCVITDTVCSRQAIDYTLHLVLIMALIVIVNFARVHSKHSIGVSMYIVSMEKVIKMSQT